MSKFDLATKTPGITLQILKMPQNGFSDLEIAVSVTLAFEF